MATIAVCWTPSVAAQTRFARPDTAVDVAAYTSVEQCLAATQRVRLAIKVREMHDPSVAIPDTMPWNPHQALEPLPAAVVMTAQRCAARFPDAAAAVADYVPLMQLYLEAGRDSAAAALLTRRLASAGPKKLEERTAVIDSAVNVYIRAQPVRLAAAEELLLNRAHSMTDRIERLKVYLEMMRVAVSAGDTVRGRHAAEIVVAVADSLTKAERLSDAFTTMLDGYADQYVYLAMNFIAGDRAVLDTLRQSTAGYAALQRRMWAMASKQRPEALPMPVGERAPPIQADFWFNRGDGDQERPVHGRVSLVVFLDPKDCNNGPMFENGDMLIEGRDCWAEVAALRRLSARFPTLDITIVSPTHGYFMFGSPTTPAQEAELIRQWFEAHHLPRPLAVSSTPFWRLPTPDARRIDKDTPNHASYTFGKSWYAPAYLIDQDGLVVYSSGVGGEYELKLAKFIDVLLLRHAGGS